MKLRKCKNGHFYDVDKFENCPHCTAMNESEETTMLKQETSVLEKNLDDDKSMVNSSLSLDEDPVTVGIFQAENIKIQPVVGWLVCIKGPSYGEAFQIKTGRNFIGRSFSMDIVLSEDISVSREKHAIVTYEPKKREFIVQAGDSRELFYLNDEVVLNTKKLNPRDILTIGKTNLMFIPFCSENISWDDFKED